MEQHKRDMALVLQASLRTAPSPARDDSPQLRPRIKQLEEEIEELHKKHSEELKSERVRKSEKLFFSEGLCSKDKLLSRVAPSASLPHSLNLVHSTLFMIGRSPLR